MSLAEVMAGVRRLVACGGDEFWYEDLTVANGTMAKLAASDGQIDTTDNLTIVEAFGKAIVLNGANKKVYDPVNSKITTTDIGANPPDFRTVLTGGSSGAKMVVDYITSLSGACTIYGYRTTTATFTVGETVTGTDDDLNAISFTTTVEVAPPHWYNFTTFGNSATFGTLPTKLYGGAMYLGSLYLIGDPDHGNEWYKSRQENIFDYLYDQDDVQSACTGGDVEVGTMQDIIRAAIPCGNDYLIFGCYGSMYVMLGDPRQGGSLKKVTGAPGIFGSKSWCRDDKDNIHYYGTGGIYRIAAGLAGVEHLTEYRLPRIIHDEGADPTTHRITMCYDHKRHGVAIGIVKLSDGMNSCYWYEKRTDGFYPEQYPEQCAPFSMLYYDSVVTAQRDMIWGCQDGYIRQPSDTARNDDIGGSDEAIDSYVTFGPFQLGEVLGEEGIVGPVYGILGETEDIACSNVTYYVYVGDSPEAVMKKVTADTYDISGTVYAPGYQKGKKQRRTVRGRYGAIRFRNSTATQTWAFEEIEVEITPAGRLS